jgi:hypothetical protein
MPTLYELRQICRERHFRRWAHLRKHELIDYLTTIHVCAICFEEKPCPKKCNCSIDVCMDCYQHLTRCPQCRVPYPEKLEYLKNNITHYENALQVTMMTFLFQNLEPHDIVRIENMCILLYNQILTLKHELSILSET